MRTLRIAFAMALVVAWVVPAAAEASRYHGRAAGNDPDGSGLIGKHRFVTGDDYAVQFRDSGAAGTRYRVCAWMRGHRKGCQSGRAGRRNHWSTVSSSSIWNPDRLGKITYRWYVGGKRVAAWSVRFEMESE